MDEKDTNTKQNDEKIFTTKKVIIIVSIFIAIVFVIILMRVLKHDNEYNLSNKEDVEQQFDITISNIDDNAQYFTKNNDTTKISYKKGAMEYEIKISKKLLDTVVDADDNWGSPLAMGTKCEDGDLVSVSAFVSLDNAKVMKAEWSDNDLYYSILTKTLSSREELLQEVNAFIIANHKKKGD